jgi:hypothetical protein
VDREVGGVDKKIRPNASHQVLLADKLAAAFKQGNQDLQGTTSDRHGLVAFPQKELRRKQAERSERNSGGRSSSFLEDMLVGIRSLNHGSRVKSRFGAKCL